MPDAAVTAPLRVAVDAHDLVRDRRGIGRYLRAVLARLARRDDVRLTLLLRRPTWTPRAVSFARALDVERVTVRRRVPADTDVVWHPWNGTFVESSRPAVATVHDVVPFAFPHPDPAIRAREQTPFRRTFASARRILADSAFTRDELVRYGALDPARIDVVPLGVDPVFAPGDLAALPAALRGRRYVLHVGAHDARKNVDTLLAAHARAFPDGATALVMTRAPRTAVPGLIVLDDVATATLVALYRAAAVVAFPSRYEGFGLPVLEAMACGAPVVAAHAASLPEVGGDAVRWVDAVDDAEAWAAALRDLADDDGARAAFGAAGIAQAATFTWERCVEATLATLRRAAAER